MMCFVEEYSCDISCLNSYMNTTEALNGTIRSIGYYGSGCRVTACHLVGHVTEGSMMGPADPPLLIPMIVGIATVTIVLGIIILYVARKENNEAPK